MRYRVNDGLRMEAGNSDNQASKDDLWSSGVGPGER